MKLYKESALSQQELQENLKYDPDTGYFYWIKHKQGRPSSDTPAGYTTHQGYRTIRLNGYVYLAHRLAFLYMTGEWPPEYVYHIDGDPHNNKWENLRLVTSQQNAWNKRRKYDSFTGVKGVRKNNLNDTWEVQIWIDDVNHQEGPFFSYQAACSRYDELAKQRNGEFHKPEPPRKQKANFTEDDVNSAIEEYVRTKYN